jgi:hypothetical protein
MGSIGEDHEALKERVAELEQQLQTTHAQVAEVARLLDPEACPDAWSLHAAAQKVKARAEQAERERGEVVGWLAEVTVALTGERPHGAMPRTTLQAAMDATTARERAEADNAALLGALRRIIDAAEATTVESRGERIAQFDWDPIYIAEDLVDAAHPGAALLERLRALEKVAVALEPMLSRIHSFRSRGDGSSLFLARDEEPGPEVMDATALEGLQNAADALEKMA